jgi:hypothetical protein
VPLWHTLRFLQHSLMCLHCFQAFLHNLSLMSFPFQSVIKKRYTNHASTYVFRCGRSKSMAAIAIAPIQMQIIKAIHHLLRTKKRLLFEKAIWPANASNINIISLGKQKYQECYWADFLNFSSVFEMSLDT